MRTYSGRVPTGPDLTSNVGGVACVSRVKVESGDFTSRPLRLRVWVIFFPSIVTVIVAGGALAAAPPARSILVTSQVPSTCLATSLAAGFLSLALGSGGKLAAGAASRATR